MSKQIISRENLMEIHKIACEGWKTKIEGYAKRNPFQSEIEFTDNEVAEMFNASDAAQKKVLSKFFTVKRIGIMGKVTSFLDACELLGVSPKDKSPFDKIAIIAKALNEGWWPDFTNESEYKYWNYFYMNKGVFSYCNPLYDISNMNVPSALYFKSNELAKYAVEIAFEEYKELYLNK